MSIRKIVLLSACCLVFLFTRPLQAEDLISIFPLDKYDQRIASWIKPTDDNYDKPVLTAEIQQQHQNKFYNHYFGTSSPWNGEYINKILRQKSPDDLKSIEQSILASFSNQNKTANEMGYGDNFQSYKQAWIDKITNNINLSQFDNFSYTPINRAITVDNLFVRVLPTTDVHFYNYKLPGQGYPFDNLQMTSVWAGTPVYILSQTRDRAWSFIVTPDVVAWVKTAGLARVSNDFVTEWSNAASKNLLAITHTETSINDEDDEFLFSAYIGSVFPGEISGDTGKLLVPAKDANHRAIIKYALVSTENVSAMPLTLTPHNMANVMSTMINRHYGWGNMYFNNDCSTELKNLLTPFGIWLPRHSSDQVTINKMVDMTPANATDRLAYLQKAGKPFLTLIYIGGHIVMYIGNHPNPNSPNHEMMAMTYQNVWGLSPNPPTRRAVIGQSVLFPMLLQYPEDSTLNSLANKKYFQVAYLDEFANTSLLQTQLIINLRHLMGLGDQKQ